MQGESLEGLSEISATVMSLAHRVRNFLDKGYLQLLSPLVIDSLYQAAANYAWYVRESSDPACGEQLVELKDLLTRCNEKWRVSGQYLIVVYDFWSRFAESA